MVGPEGSGGGGGGFGTDLMMVNLGEDPSNTCRLSRRVRMLYAIYYILSTHLMVVPAMRNVHSFKS